MPNYDVFVPKYIKQTLADRPRKVIPATRWNELWNLAIQQGDWNSETMASVCTALVNLVTDYTSTKTALTTEVGRLNTVILENEADIETKTATNLATLLALIAAHKASTADHTDLFYTKTQLDPMLRGGDTIIKEEAFTIVNADNGDGTFTYSYCGDNVIGTITTEGYQQFTLQTGTYPVHENKIECYIGDVLRRTSASGGIRESSTTTFDLINSEAANTEITVKYYEKVGLLGEHSITHNIGGSDEISDLLVNRIRAYMCV